MATLPDRNRVCAKKATIKSLVNILWGQTGHPISDKTGLTGYYDFSLEFTSEIRPVAATSAITPASQTELSTSTASVDGAPPLGAALRKQLGLKLELRRAPAEILVIDRAERVPTDN